MYRYVGNFLTLRGMYALRAHLPGEWNSKSLLTVHWMVFRHFWIPRRKSSTSGDKTLNKTHFGYYACWTHCTVGLKSKQHKKAMIRDPWVKLPDPDGRERVRARSRTCCRGPRPSRVGPSRKSCPRPARCQPRRPPTPTDPSSGSSGPGWLVWSGILNKL